MARSSFKPSRVSRIVSLLAVNAAEEETSAADIWLRAVTSLCEAKRPDLGGAFRAVTGSTPLPGNPLELLGIAEIGMVYEALLATTDPTSRRSNGQYFTPDDAATFMAGQARNFPRASRWLDPCCGVGNLAWHLCAAVPDSDSLLHERLTLVDKDQTALTTAVCVLAAEFSAAGDSAAVTALWQRSRVGNFLDLAHELDVDFAIVNPPYAKCDKDLSFRTYKSADSYAYFLERLSENTDGFIAITPGSFLTARKYSALRILLRETYGHGEVFVFDNVPDTIFRGFKFGSTNTSNTNFVRATVTVTQKSAPFARGSNRASRASSISRVGWLITPILRWKSTHRSELFARASSLLTPLRLGPGGEWMKVMPETASLYDALVALPTTLADLRSRRPTPFKLEIASTPRYFTSATMRGLERASKHVIYFKDEQSYLRAYLLLNSSLLYWWWRCMDGGITLTVATFKALPVPEFPIDAGLVRSLQKSENENLVTKLNAGKVNENVKHPSDLVERLDAHILGDDAPDFSRVFSPNLFA